ncbi:NAD(P)-dependent oxidoreductase [Brevibacillus formosus]|uniref:NAD-dependent epimerase/dehydratase family protein n=1 Tax=Brevibacillus formosus TaxID=54913 RepID=UPI0018CFDF5A|nr:NAD(P)-dependent oxidoreductase [Brevibacillus formosus]MBG9941035.1 hypothetical protein [Brevibacillus formosus]
MKCVVTGGSGFVGSFIVEELVKRGNEVVIVDLVPPNYELPEEVKFNVGSTLYPETMRSAFAGATEVYDVAGVLGTEELMSDNGKAIDVNIKGTFNCLDLALVEGVKRFFYPTKPNEWLNTYSITKIAGEKFCEMYRRAFGLDVTILRWFNAYGPRQHLYPVRKAVPLFIIQALYGLDIEVFGDGEQTVEMVYVEDMARIVVDATRSSLGMKAGKVLDLGSGQVMTVNHLCKEIIRIVNAHFRPKNNPSPSQIRHLPMRMGEPMRTHIQAELADLRNHMHIPVFTDVEIGLIKTIEYYNNLPKVEVMRALQYFQSLRQTEVLV